MITKAELFNLLKDVFGIEPLYLKISKGNQNLIEYGENCARGHLCLLQKEALSYSFRYISDKELSAKDTRTLLTILFMKAMTISSSTQSDIISGTGLIEIISEQTSIDKVLTEILNSMTETSNFENVGVMFLNEKLLELRGVILKSVSEDKEKKFKLFKISLENGSKLTDVMFFHNTEIIDLLNLEGGIEISEFFNRRTIITSLGTKNQSTGILLASRNAYRPSDIDIVRLFGGIATLSMEYTKTLKKLDLTKQDLESKEQSVLNINSLSKMGSLTATVAHELKNPLVAISGFAQRLVELAKETNNKQVESYSQMIHSESLRLESLVKDILAYSRKFQIQSTSLLLKDEVKAVINTLMQNINHIDKTISLNISEKIRVKVDKDRFRQVLINIIDNGLQATDDFGALHIYSEIGAHSIILNIEDSGGGLSPKDMENIFEPFYTTKKEGTGLGLSISKKIMVAHGGDITAQNINEGAVFSIIIPSDEANYEF